MEARIGELAALLTAVCWTATAIAFEAASRKVGSVPVNIIRLVMALVLISLFSWFRRGMFLPMDATVFNWQWLALSGLIGFVVGDLFLFKAFTVIGSRLTLLVMTLVPPVAAFAGWLMLGERLALIHLFAMLLTIAGIAMVIVQKRQKKSQQENVLESVSPLGLFYALMGTIGQGTGLVLSKYGMGDYDAISANQIRVMAGIVGFTIVVHFFRKWLAVNKALKNTKALKIILIGAVLGPFAGVSLSLIAVKHTAAGIASTLMSISPILILPATYFLYKHKVSSWEMLGAIISICGVTLFFLW
ncbi:MAG: DMT family transporter [Bacteroidales bacterium]|nr:DMT family transporter [Bacteroidales bacterium]